MSVWTEEFTNLIVRRYLRGEGCSELAREFGLTRNQVLAKLNRTGHVRRKSASPPRPATSLVAARAAAKKIPMKKGSGFVLPSYGGPARASGPEKSLDAIRANNAAKADPPPEIALSAAWKPLAGIEPVPFVSRSGRQCRWPVGGSGADMMCCGAYAMGNYCLAHTRLGQVGAPVRDRLGIRLPRNRTRAA